MEGLNCSRPDTDTGGAKYDSSQGRQLCRKILAEYVPYDPTTPTGSGKTGYLILLMLVVRKIAVEKVLAVGTETFPEDPVMIVVCPTKALEENIVGPIINNVRMPLIRT